MSDAPVTRQGGCHCGAVRFEVTLRDDLSRLVGCSCSICRMRGAITATADLDKLRITQGADKLRLYQFGTHTAKHYFCEVCGIYTHHQRRSNPNEFGVNVACLDGVSPFDFTDVKIVDGVNHASDTGKMRVFGVRKFEKR